MYGFYLHAQIKPSRNISIQTLKFEQFSDLQDLKNNCLYLFVDTGTEQIVQSGEFNLYVIGTVIYRKKWGNQALNFILQDLKSGSDVQDIAMGLKGQFCLVIDNNQEIYIITDRLASFSIFRVDNSTSTHISNILPYLLKHNNVSFNPQRVSEYMSLGYCIDSTFFNEIQCLEMATIYRFGNKNSKVKYDNSLENIKFDRYKDPGEVANIIIEICSDNLSFLDQNDRIFVDITGGFDSRTIATCY